MKTGDSDAFVTGPLFLTVESSVGLSAFFTMMSSSSELGLFLLGVEPEAFGFALAEEGLKNDLIDGDRPGRKES